LDNGFENNFSIHETYLPKLWKWLANADRLPPPKGGEKNHD